MRPFINCTATLTINGGSLTLPEVIAAMEQAAHFHVNLEELMEKAGDRLAELLQVEWGIVTAGTSAALTHATAGVLAGTDPEKIQRLPNLEGLKNEVIIPRESRKAYDHAVRTLGVNVIEVNSPEELRAAIGPHTAMIEVLGNYFGKASLDLKDIAPIARPAGIPILVDAAADYLIVPNPYIAQGADLVAYSGGKIIRGPQGGGLLVGRRDLVRAAWANSAPHHAFGRALKVTKEEIVGMLRAVEAWRSERDLRPIFERGNRGTPTSRSGSPKWRACKRKCGPIRGGPFPTLNISWDPDSRADRRRSRPPDARGRAADHDPGRGRGPLVPARPVAMKPGEYKIVAHRLYEVFSSAGKKKAERPRAVRRQRRRRLGCRDPIRGRLRAPQTVAGRRRKPGYGHPHGLGVPGRSQGRNRRRPRDCAAPCPRTATCSPMRSPVVAGGGISGDVRIGEYGSASGGPEGIIRKLGIN